MWITGLKRLPERQHKWPLLPRGSREQGAPPAGGLLPTTGLPSLCHLPKTPAGAGTTTTSTLLMPECWKHFSLTLPLMYGKLINAFSWISVTGSSTVFVGKGFFLFMLGTLMYVSCYWWFQVANCTLVFLHSCVYLETIITHYVKCITIENVYIIEIDVTKDIFISSVSQFRTLCDSGMFV